MEPRIEPASWMLHNEETSTRHIYTDIPMDASLVSTASHTTMYSEYVNVNSYNVPNRLDFP